MGLIVDTSIWIAWERGRFNLETFLKGSTRWNRRSPPSPPLSCFRGIERAVDPIIKARRTSKVEGVLALVKLMPFDLPEARVHARIRAQLEATGQLIGPHDLLIAATALAAGFELATLKVGEFSRVPGLSVIDAGAFRIEVKK